MLVVGLVFGWIARGREQQESVRRMHAQNPGAALLYGYEVNPAGRVDREAQPPGPEWLRRWLGLDFVASIVGADLFYPTDADIQRLAEFPKLRRLVLERAVDLTDEGLARIATMRSLQYLVLGEADQVSDAGLMKLAALGRLKELRLDLGRRMSREGIERLREKLPQCKITVRENYDELAASY